MGSVMSNGKINLIPDEKYKEEVEWGEGYPFIVPTVYLDAVSEVYFPQAVFSWSEESVIVKRKNFAIKYTSQDYCELAAEDGNGKKIWIDSREAPSAEELGVRYLNESRGAMSFTTTLYDTATLTKKVIKYKTENSESLPMDEHEIGEFAEMSSSSVLGDEDKMIALIKKDCQKYADLPDELKHSVEFNIKLIEKTYDVSYLDFVPDDVKNNAEIINAVLLKRGGNLRYLSDKVKDDYDIVLSIVTRQGGANALEGASERLRDDYNLVKKAINNDGCAIEFASDRLKHCDELIRTALLNNGSAYRLLPEDVRKKREYALIALKYSRNVYGFSDALPDELKNDKELTILRIKCHDFVELSDEMKNDRDIARALIQTNPFFFKNAPTGVRNDEELARLAISEDAKNMRFITDEALINKLTDEDPILGFFIKA